MRSLLRLHPLCCFIYFAAVMGITIFTREPILLALSAAGGCALLAVSGRLKSAAASLVFIPLGAVTNPIFSHNGDTVMFFVGDTAITLESVLYGAVFGLVLAAALMWSVCSTVYLTSDKYIWLFSKVAPSAGLTLSCALRFVPLFIRRGRDFAAAQQASTVTEHLRAYSAAIGYSAEEAMAAADSMQARGYGTAVRSSYSLYRFAGTDAAVLAVTLVLSVCCVVLMVCGAGEFEFYPRVSEISFSVENIALYSAFGVLCILPAAAAVSESVKRACHN